MAVSRQVIIHEGPGGSFESMWVGDAHGGAKPGILLFPNILGTKEWDFAKAEEVAALGYTVLVADLYGQGKRGTSMESGMALMKEVSDDRTVMRARLLDELATLKGSPAVDTSRLGAIGFCFGGQCVLDLARAGADIKGGVSFHGVYDAPPFPNAPISAKLLICHGWSPFHAGRAGGAGERADRVGRRLANPGVRSHRPCIHGREYTARRDQDIRLPGGHVSPKLEGDEGFLGGALS